MLRRLYFVYIMASESGVLYTGVTGDLDRRVAEHAGGAGGLFTSRYRVRRLVYFETSTDVRAAILREKQIKGWVRRRKIELIESANPGWVDLARTWEHRRR